MNITFRLLSLLKLIALVTLTLSSILWLNAPSHAGTTVSAVASSDNRNGTVYIVAIGVDRYTDAFPKQSYAVADAEAVAKAFASSWKRTGQPVDVQLLMNEDLSRASLQSALAHVSSSAEPNDLFIFFFAGLSETVHFTGASDDEYYLLTSACVDATRRSLSEQAVPAALLKTWCAGVQAKRQLIILDASSSGGTIAAFVNQAIQSTLEQKVNTTNTVLLTSEGVATERPDLDHGLLTYVLLKGLSHDAVLTQRFPAITAREMEAYLPAQILKMSDGRQIFRSYSSGGDFEIAPLPPSFGGELGASATTRQTEPVNAPEPDSPDNKPVRGTYYALIFATSHYNEWQALANPLNDAQAVADELKRQYGFETQVVSDPTKRDVESILIQYRNRIYNPEDQLFIFFAGHGTKGNGDGYIVTKDSKRQDEFFESYIPYAFLKNALTGFPCPHIMLSLDVCYGGNFVNDSVEALPDEVRPLVGNTMFRLAGDDITPVPLGSDEDTLQIEAARLMKEKSRIFLSSGSDEPVPDGTDGHSPFAQKLLDDLKQHATLKTLLTANDMYEDTQTLVTKPEHQIFDNSHPDGDFVFVPDVPAPTSQ